MSMAWSRVTKRFTSPNVHAKNTGRASYTEDFRVEGKTFTRPIPHAPLQGLRLARAVDAAAKNTTA